MIPPSAHRFAVLLLASATLTGCVSVGGNPADAPSRSPGPSLVPASDRAVASVEASPAPTQAVLPGASLPAGSSVLATAAPSGDPQASVPPSASSPAQSSSAESSARPSIQPLPSLPAVPPLATDERPRLSKEVVAYLPYWVATSSDVPYDPSLDPYILDSRLTDLVMFSIGIRRNGSLRLDTPGAAFILGPRATALITEAHTRGIRVLVSFTSSGYANNAKLFGDTVAMDRFVREASGLVQARGLDGADLDIELIDGDQFDAYATTAGTLKEALVATDRDARVTVATNGNRSGARMAKRAIAAGADRAFLMGYAYRGPTSGTVGSIAPLQRTDGGLGLRDSLALYQQRGVPLDHVIIGLPAYGLTWATVGPELHAERAPARISERGRVTLFRNAASGAPPGAIIDSDPVEGSARITWYDPERGSWFQTYYDTPDTLRAKYLLALESGAAGIGIWTLGYDAGSDAYPALIGDIFGRPVVATVLVTPTVSDSLAVEVSATTFDGPAATDGVRISNDGLEWSAWMDVAQLDPARDGPLPWRLAPGPDGDRAVWVQSRDVDGALSVPIQADVLLDRSPPVIRGFSLRPAPIPGWIALYSAHDDGGVATTQIRWRTDDGAWSDWSTIDTLANGSRLAPAAAHVTAQLRVTDRAGTTTTATTDAGPWSAP